MGEDGGILAILVNFSRLIIIAFLTFSSMKWINRIKMAEVENTSNYNNFSGAHEGNSVAFSEPLFDGHNAMFLICGWSSTCYPYRTS